MADKPDVTGSLPPVTRPRLRIILRSTGGENSKNRPPWYSKLLALASVLRAVQESGPSTAVTYWNDGPIPADRLERMRATGEVVQVRGGSNRSTYRSAVQYAARTDWDPTDVVWFAEDDYLYRPEAFRQLIDAAVAIPDADYLSVYGGNALDPTSSRTSVRRLEQRGAAGVADPIEVGGALWFRGMSTTSTFGVRQAVLREDQRLLRMMPYTGGAWDHTTMLVVQGLQPFDRDRVRPDLLPFAGQPPARWPRAIARGLLRLGVNLRSHRLPAHRRVLFLCDPVGALHMETPIHRSTVDWEALVHQTRAWARQQGIPLGAEPTDSSLTGS